MKMENDQIAMNEVYGWLDEYSKGNDEEVIPEGAEVFAVYSADDNSLEFYNALLPAEDVKIYNGKAKTAVYKNFIDRDDWRYASEESSENILTPWYENRANITSVNFNARITPSSSTSCWFINLRNCDTFSNLDKLNVSNVTDMSYMFEDAGYSETTWSIGDLSSWNVSSATDMTGMFSVAGYNATTWNAGNLRGWNVDKVTNYYNFGGKFTAEQKSVC